MALRCLRLLKNIRCNTITSNWNISNNNSMATFTSKNKYNPAKEFRTENNIIYSDDPDTFGTLTRNTIREHIEEDEGDIKEEKYLQELPLQSQKLTIKQYADIIKQYVENKRLKEAIDVLEVRMLQEDRVKPENYIYNILIGACADVGYTKKAFKLYNDMKRRALKPTGDTYTCLFTACLNSPWVEDGLRNARNLRALMIEKGIEPNLTNYNVMIKTFGRCGDLPTAFKIVDEMVSKKIKIRVHTFNHLLQACITDKDNGLRLALIVWRKMLRMREKPNVYSFNLMLKCVKDCNLGNKEDIMELIGTLEEGTLLPNFKRGNKPLEIESAKAEISGPMQSCTERSTSKLSEISASVQNYTEGPSTYIDTTDNPHSNADGDHHIREVENIVTHEDDKEKSVKHIYMTNSPEKVAMEFVDYKKKMSPEKTTETVPNLLSKTLQLDKVFALQDIYTLQDKFAIVGGQEEFLKEMAVYSVQPDIKIFTQMLPLIDNSIEAEMKLIDDMQSAKVKPDIDFYNLLIRKRCLRFDYDKALEVKEMIVKERKKRHPLSKKHQLKENIMTYGVLALACRTKDSAVGLLEEIKEKKIKINIQILGALLKQGIAHTQFEYIKYIMNVLKEEQLMVNEIFIQNIEDFNDKCAKIIKQTEEKGTKNQGFEFAFKKFLRHYKEWLKEVNAEEALKEEHPWKQFQESYPTTVQREHFQIKEPKKFYKRNRKFVMYAPQVK